MVSEQPVLSVLLPTDSLSTVRDSLECFRTQEDNEQLEIVIAAPVEARIDGSEPELAGFQHVQIVEIERRDWEAGDLTRLTKACARAVRVARGPLVVFAESHAFPRPGYVRALIRAHAEPWGAVGPSVSNANPSAVSWSSLFMDYGRWVDYAERGPKDDVPGHNSAYRRTALLALGPRLDDLLHANSVMHAELRAAGYELMMEPDAVVDHMNVSSFGWSMRERFQSGRNFAAVRCRDWPTHRRAAYTLGAPLIPPVRLWRTLREVRRARRSRQLPQILPVLLIALCFGAAGEATGYATGRSGETRLLCDIELHRTQYLKPSHRRRWQPALEPA